MRNRIAVSLRRNWRRIATGGVATFAVTGVAAGIIFTGGPATAHGLVDSGRVKNQSLGHWDVKDQTLGHWDIKDGTIGWFDIRRGTIGPFRLTDDTRTRLLNDGRVKERHLSDELKQKVNQGGEQGPKGEPGEDGVSGYEVVAKEIELDGSTNGTVTAQCPEDKVAVGGGYEIGGNNRDAVSIMKDGFGQLTEQEDGDWVASSYVVRATPADAGGNTHPTVKAYASCAAVN